MPRKRKLYQFKITLKGTKPPVWRRIQVPASYSFWDLHVAIQDAMGWLDYHLHEFRIRNPKNGEIVTIGIPDDEFGFGNKILQGWSNKINRYFNEENQKAEYIYDFGDDWVHKIEFEKEVLAEDEKTYPACIAGKRACPPEDCGGTYMYQLICEGNEEVRELYPEFDSEEFDPKAIKFDDPKKRFDQNFELIE
jgi:hypothetical protein